MKLYDQHLHSRHSFDSTADPQANVVSAISHGLAGLTFTEHFDPHPQEWPDCIYDDDAYSETIKRLRVGFESDIFIGKGIEIGYCRERMDFVLDFLLRHEFDLVILSVHYFGGRALHVRAQWDGVDPAEGTRRYLESVLEAVRFCRSIHDRRGRVFHVLGHLDLVKRYTRRFFGVYDVSACAELIDDILQACLEARLIPEINTSTLRQDLDEPLPGPGTIARYTHLGGRAMTLGSDAHRSEDIAGGFDHALQLLRAAGIDRIALFERGEQRNVPRE